MISIESGPGRANIKKSLGRAGLSKPCDTMGRAGPRKSGPISRPDAGWPKSHAPKTEIEYSHQD